MGTTTCARTCAPTRISIMQGVASALVRAVDPTSDGGPQGQPTSGGQASSGGGSATGFEAAFQANTSNLWTVGSAGNDDWQLGMMSGTSPSITAVPGGFEAAFQANTSNLWTVGSAGNTDWRLGMMSGTSPSITAVPGG